MIKRFFLKHKLSPKNISVVLALFFLIASGFLARPLLAEYALSKAVYYFNGGAYDLSAAEKWYKVGGFFDPNSQAVHYQLARIYFLQGKFDIARKEIGIELQNFPNFKRSHYVSGLINGYDGRFQQAIGDFEEFLKWKPSSWAAWNDLAWVYFQLGNFEKVLSLADSGLKYNPDNPWLLNAKGLALRNLDKENKAKEYFGKALKEAEKLGVEDWKMAYPGNDPALSAQGLNQMLNAIKSNKDLSVGAAFIFSSYKKTEKTPSVELTLNSFSPKGLSGGIMIPASCESGYTGHENCAPACTARCGDWYACTSSCGGGRQAKSCVRSDCSEYSEEQDCNMQACPCAPNCGNTNNYCSGESYGDGCGGTCWGTRGCCNPSCGDWSGCSASCGGGSQSRTCTRGDCSTYGESQSCNTQCCPQDGGWSGWSGCSVSCGGGSQSRSCTNPSPYCGGAGCSGPSSQSCNTYACIGSFNLNLGGSVVCNSVPLSWTPASGANAYRILRGSPRIDISPYQPYIALNFTDTTVSQNTTYPYQIEAYNSGTTNRSNTINVSVPYCPPTLNFSADNTSIWQGQSIVLSWITSYIASCTASGAWSGSKPVNGSQIIVPLP
ncbi:MAG: tetratricopeptide repeat protein, partial [Patescibacteria group bacterium]